MKAITIVADDRIGLLADMSYILGKARINIESVSVDVVGGKAVVVLMVKDPKAAKEVLERNNYKVNEENSVVIKLSDQPGELSRVTAMLAKEKIDIKNVHMLSRDGKASILSITVDRPRKAEEMLKDLIVHGD
ncbi:MAG: ACT domain-containing protein [Candidatus Micrarchaeia archaeon]|jgi:hypothetical protein